MSYVARWLFVFAMIVTLGAGCVSPGENTASQTETSNNVTSTPSAMQQTWTYQGALPPERITNKQARISTNKGDIVITFYPDTAPLAVSNFIYLAEGGYYDGVIFHRVIENFMIQGGDPTGTGRGGPGYQFNDELADDHTYTRGTVAMANAGSNTNGSQFFVMHANYPLPHQYTIFGYVIEGLDVVDAVAAVETGAGDRPLENIVMNKVTIEDLAK